eukprot:TRINITY_DN30788_c0_g1_i1.p1 TRINITY_DN30788_c0_g1~~TRINITY_DN30788_c0_g1_i1.p1  ORF type:complete len:103 (+),score=24.07 TRINITY_DN30788_c0_g1_i1:408-716(+)
MAAAFKRLIPLLDRVLVEKIVAPTKSAGGILLPETAASKLNSGKVVAVGPGAPSREGSVIIPCSVKEGDTVLLPEYGGIAIKHEDKEFVLYRNEDIPAILES